MFISDGLGVFNLDENQDAFPGILINVVIELMFDFVQLGSLRF